MHLLERYFVSETLLFPPRPRTRIEDRVASFAIYLEQVRGLASSSIEAHCKTTSALLAHIGYERRPRRLGALTARDIEAFICRGGKGLGRRSLQHMVTRLRAFLRFAGSRGEAPIGLDRQIDTPRVYQRSSFPGIALKNVQALLRTIDRTTPGGLRDYAILLLIATYGLRASEIVGVTLDDVEWRARRLRVRQRKTGGVLWLPLTDEVATALLDYLREGRLQLAVRRYRRGFQTDPRQYGEVFLRCRTPAGVLQSTAIAEAFQAWSRRSGLKIPFQGVHCLRHSYALHLLRSGLSLKTIGDLLGHRSSESTCVYLRLATDDLREVALSYRQAHPSSGAGERAMKAPRAFTSLLAPDIMRYLTVKHALGREYSGVSRVLAHIDHFLMTRGGELTPATFAGWSLTLEHLASGTRRRPHAGRAEFLSLSTRGLPAAFVPDERLFPSEHQVIRPHLFTEAEVLRLLDLVAALPPAPTSPLRRENLHLAIVILYTTGCDSGSW